MATFAYVMLVRSGIPNMPDGGTILAHGLVSNFIDFECEQHCNKREMNDFFLGKGNPFLRHSVSICASHNGTCRSSRLSWIIRVRDCTGQATTCPSPGIRELLRRGTLGL